MCCAQMEVQKDFTNNSILDAESNKYWGANIIEDRSLGFFSKDGILKKYFGGLSKLSTTGVQNSCN